MTDPATQFTVPAAADAVAAVIGDREFIIQGDRRYTYAQIVERSNRLAAYLHSRGLGCKTERSELAGHEVGQDLLGIYAYNGPEYVEAMLGSWRARVAPFNVNYRYVKSELQYLLADSGATALLYHAAFAPRVADVLPELPKLRVLIQIADESGNDLRARRRRLRIDRQVRPIGPATGRTVSRRPVRALHRRHDRHAQGRAVAPARHLHDIVRRAEPLHRRRRRFTRRDRQGRCRKPRHQADGSASADARRRAVGVVHGDEYRPVRGVLVGHQPARPRRCRRHHRAGEGHGGHRWSATRWPDHSPMRSNARRPTCRRLRWSPTVAPC